MSNILNTNNIDLNLLGEGQVAQAYGIELAKVMKNIKDLNTDPTAKREITIKVSFKPVKNRNMCSTEYEVRSKVAPTTPKISVSGLIGMDANNQLALSEFGEGQIPGQMDAGEVIDVTLNNAAANAGFKA